MKIDTIERAKVEKLTEPARQWRNWFVTIAPHKDCDGRVCTPGERTHEPRTWPTKEIAEQKAAEHFAGMPAALRLIEYLGAFPVTP